MAQPAFGWLPDIPDIRDVPFRNVFRVPRKLPARIDLSAECSPVEDQGNLGSCTAQALAGALEFLQLRSLAAAAGLYRDLSRLFIYYNERAAMGTVNEDSGAMLRTGIKTLKKLGVCVEKMWPYRVRRFAEKPAPECYSSALEHQATGYQRLLTLHEMKACLAGGLPFVFGFAVYEHVTSPETRKTGRIRMPRPGERMTGGHAVMATGYDDKRQVLLFRNSWGKEWGKSGYGTLPYRYLQSGNLARDFWCIQTTESNRYAALKLRARVARA